MTRRAVCATLPALAVPAALPLAANATPTGDERFMALYHAWLAIHEEWNTPNGHLTMDEETRWSRELGSRQYAILAQMEIHRPKTREGILALLWVQWRESGPVSTVGSDAWREELEEGDFRMMIAVWRSITGLDGLPRRLV
ncbi:hypothetical protein [uncultured Jannaschia sp.]|uniref:hypothetical protein n=1 Tax=uncultured Jannaschia sp. TaxID=293347 RepID=UPI002629CC72|nr:hypothetical protein [uncultured Jannaschia sp.]